LTQNKNVGYTYFIPMVLFRCSIISNQSSTCQLTLIGLLVECLADIKQAVY